MITALSETESMLKQHSGMRRGGETSWDRKDTSSFPGSLSHLAATGDKLAKNYTRQRQAGAKIERQWGAGKGSSGASLTRKGLSQIGPLQEPGMLAIPSPLCV